jgi:hypothetical protein
LTVLSGQSVPYFKRSMRRYNSLLSGFVYLTI